MINFHFGLTVPSTKESGPYKRLWDTRIKVSTNKSIEFNGYYRGWRELFAIQFNLIPTGRSHAGLYTSMCLLGFEAEFEFYDLRHWNYDACRYATPDEANDW